MAVCCSVDVIVLLWLVFLHGTATQNYITDNDIVNLGCYQMRDIDFREISSSLYPPRMYDDQRVGLNVDEALDECRQHCGKTYKTTYFATKRTSLSSGFVKCYCGNNDRHKATTDDNCTFRCGQQDCGGSGGHVSVYSVCPVGSYSVAGHVEEICSRRCHCANNDVCALIDGVCPQGCQQGWTGVDCDTDLDECLIINGGCDQICVNTAPGYSCGCHHGYVLDPDNKTCTDIDECSTGLHTCKVKKEQCWNKLGSFVCCPNGTEYVTSEDMCRVDGSAGRLTQLAAAVGSAAAGCLMLTVIIGLAICLYRSRKLKDSDIRQASQRDTTAGTHSKQFGIERGAVMSETCLAIDTKQCITSGMSAHNMPQSPVRYVMSPALPLSDAVYSTIPNTVCLPLAANPAGQEEYYQEIDNALPTTSSMSRDASSGHITGSRSRDTSAEHYVPMTGTTRRTACDDSTALHAIRGVSREAAGENATDVQYCNMKTDKTG